MILNYFNSQTRNTEIHVIRNVNKYEKLVSAHAGLNCETRNNCFTYFVGYLYPMLSLASILLRTYYLSVTSNEGREGSWVQISTLKLRQFLLVRVSQYIHSQNSKRQKNNIFLFFTVAFYMSKMNRKILRLK